MIYFIKQIEDSIVKIGFTNNIKHRLATIQTNNPRKLEIILLLDGDHEYELFLHNKFAEDRSHNEWFFMSDNIKKFINEKKELDLRYFENTINDNFKNSQLKYIRKQHKLGLREMGLKLNITAQSLREIELREKSGAITLNSLSKYANALGYELKYKLIKIEML